MSVIGIFNLVGALINTKKTRLLQYFFHYQDRPHAVYNVLAILTKFTSLYALYTEDHKIVKISATNPSPNKPLRKLQFNSKKSQKLRQKMLIFFPKKAIPKIFVVSSFG